MTVDLDAVLGLAVNVTVLIAALAAGVVWLRKWLRAQVVKPMTEAAHQLQPNGGTQETTRHLIEQTHESTSAMQAQLDTLTEKSNENHEIGTAALTLAREVSHRLDRHLIEGHRPA